MSGIEQQKNINFGAKFTGKIAGGIYLTGNDASVTTLPAGGVWVPIGNGSPNHPLFILMPIQPVIAPLSSGINDYFELQNPLGPTTVQRLWYRYGKRAVHYCEYTLTLLADEIPVSLGVRVSSINPSTLVTTSYPQSNRIIDLPFDGSFKLITHVFPLVAPSSDAFYIELLSLTGQESTLIVTEAFLSVVE